MSRLPVFTAVCSGVPRPRGPHVLKAAGWSAQRRPSMGAPAASRRSTSASRCGRAPAPATAPCSALPRRASPPPASSSRRTVASDAPRAAYDSGVSARMRPWALASAPCARNQRINASLSVPTARLRAPSRTQSAQPRQV